MNQFIIQFYFQDQAYLADVTELDGLDRAEYAISPRDEQLSERFKSSVIVKDKADAKYHYALPSAPSGTEYMAVLKTALDDFLAKKNS